jgi:hypothetical protein
MQRTSVGGPCVSRVGGGGGGEAAGRGSCIGGLFLPALVCSACSYSCNTSQKAETNKEGSTERHGDP